VHNSQPILIIVGARPNFVKVAPLLRACEAAALPALVVHTGQHYDARLSDAFFQALEIRDPDFHLELKARSRIGQVAEIVAKLEGVFAESKPRAVCVIGDVTSTLAAAVAAASADIPVAHIEAGLRSFDRSMPEEINRVMTDSVSSWFFVSEPAGVEHLQREGQPADRIHLVGDLIVDAMRMMRDRAEAAATWQRWKLTRGAYALVTLHRPVNVDNLDGLRQCLEILRTVARRQPVVFPLHPRTKRRLEEHGLLEEFQAIDGLIACEPLDYLEFLSLLVGAAFTLSDSGGVQLEATVLDVPCLTLRETTERPLTISAGTNTLVTRNVRAVDEQLSLIAEGRYKRSQLPPYWDGHAADRIAQILARA
jgi:UDP-N-acetylglucosamine 2-epimerase (non-hydrolysing)